MKNNQNVLKSRRKTFSFFITMFGYYLYFLLYLLTTATNY